MPNCCAFLCVCLSVNVQARGRVPGKTGVWVGERKIGAVGVRITHGISSHGIALNVTTDLSAYKHIVPCGTPDKEVTSVLQELPRRPGGGGVDSGGGCGGASLLAAAEQCLVDSLVRELGFLDAVVVCTDEGETGIC